MGTSLVLNYHSYTCCAHSDTIILRKSQYIDPAQYLSPALNYLRKIYHRLAFRFYVEGKAAYEQYVEQLLLSKATVGAGTRIYPGADIQNLAHKKDAIQIGANCHISGLLLTYQYGGQIKIGDNCSLSQWSRIISCKQIVIGNRVLIAHNVNIIDNISHPIDANLRHEDFLNSYTVGMKQYDLKAADITINDDVWIGYNSSILKGVTIGQGAIIGSGSLVTKNVEPWTVNVGNPLKVIRILEPVEIKKGNTE